MVMFILEEALINKTLVIFCSTKAAEKPITGDIKRAITIFTIPIISCPDPVKARQPQRIFSGPPESHTAPIMAPTRECVELEGIPEYQVKMFQIIAPPSAANITGSRASSAGRSIREETVSATAVPPVRAPRRLKHEASNKACLGLAALLVIKVATTALAE